MVLTESILEFNELKGGSAAFLKFDDIPVGSILSKHTNVRSHIGSDYHEVLRGLEK